MREVIDEFEVISTTNIVLGIIEDYRFVKYQKQSWSGWQKGSALVESGFEYEIEEWMCSPHRVYIFLGASQDGVKVRLEIEEKQTAKVVTPSPRQYAEELIGEISAKAPRIHALRNEPQLNQREAFELRAVRNWPIAQQQGVRQEDYVKSVGVTARQLRRWEQAYRKRGFDTRWEK